MNAPAKTQAPATRPVLLRVTEPALLDILRLPEGTTLHGAQAEHYPGTTLVLYLEMPGVPEGANEVCPQYERDTSAPDPVRLTALRWFNGSDEIGETPVGR